MDCGLWTRGGTVRSRTRTPARERGTRHVRIIAVSQSCLRSEERASGRNGPDEQGAADFFPAPSCHIAQEPDCMGSNSEVSIWRGLAVNARATQCGIRKLSLSNSRCRRSTVLLWRSHEDLVHCFTVEPSGKSRCADRGCSGTHGLRSQEMHRECSGYFFLPVNSIGYRCVRRQGRWKM